MIAYRRLKPALLGLLMLAASIPAAMAQTPDAPVGAPAPEMARVWVLRPSSPSSAGYGASPRVYANGTPIGTIPEGSKFHREFAPGTYRFTVDPYGTPTNAADTVELTPGSETYLEVQWLPTGEEGYTTGGRSSFFVTTMGAQIAQIWLPALTDVSGR